MEFDNPTSGASLTTPAQASSLRIGGYAMLNGFPCKISDMSVSKTGKHGHAKVHLEGYDIFTNNKYVDNCPSSHNIDVPIVARNEYTILMMDDDGFLSVLTKDGKTRDDLNAPSELFDIIKSGLDEGKELIAATTAAMGEEKVMSIKEAH